MIKKNLFIIMAFVTMLAILGACNQATPTPVVETVVVRETVEVEKEVVVTQEVEKVVTVEVEKEVVVTQEVEKVVTVEVEKEVPVVETVEVIKVVTVEVTPEPATTTPEPTPDTSSPIVNQILNEMTFVQHSYNTDLERDEFVCASQGEGLTAVQTSAETQSASSPRFVGPNDGDLPLWGVNGLFEVQPDGTTFFVPQVTGARFVSPDGIEYARLPLNEALDYFAAGDAFWTGDPGGEGRIAECDPLYQEGDED